MMKTMTRRSSALWRLLTPAVALGAALALVACGADDASGGGSPSGGDGGGSSGISQAGAQDFGLF